MPYYRMKFMCLMFTLFISGACIAKNTLGNDAADFDKPVSSDDDVDPTKTIFPLANYSQSVDTWISPWSDKINIPIIADATQQRYFSELKSHYFGMDKEGHSPWNPHYISTLLSGSDSARSVLDASISKFLGTDSISYGENFRVNSLHWKEEVRDNTNINIDGVYHGSDRAITIRETLVRVLPTVDPAFDDPRKAGEGYPFDNLQMSSIRPGTPVYVFATSKDKNWKYVVSPTVMGWVGNNDVAGVDQQFITDWTSLAEKNLGAFIKEPVSVHDGDLFYFIARPGTILPFRSLLAVPDHYLVAVPFKKSDGNAQINWVSVKKDEFTAMPWKMTPGNMAWLMKSMSGRPYGWGNYNFYNDCSAEIRSLMMPFGIFLPRNSAAQIQLQQGKVVDLSKDDVSTRIKYLKDHGKPFATLVYIPGHIMLYIGNATVKGEEVPMTYQDIWGLRPRDSHSRSIIGGSVFLPILSIYPENPDLTSLAGREQFKLGFIE